MSRHGYYVDMDGIPVKSMKSRYVQYILMNDIIESVT